MNGGALEVKEVEDVEEVKVMEKICHRGTESQRETEAGRQRSGDAGTQRNRDAQKHLGTGYGGHCVTAECARSCLTLTFTTESSRSRRRR